MHRPQPLLSALLLLAAAAPPLRADVVVTALGRKEPVRGIALTLDADHVAVQSAEGPVVKIATRDAVEIRRVPAPKPPPEATRLFRVVLRDGSRLHGVLGEVKEGIRLRSKVLGEAGHLDLSLEEVVEVRRIAGGAIPGASRLIRLPDTDAAYRRSGARVTGFVAGFRATGVEIDRGDAGTTLITYDDLAAIFLENPEQPAAEGLHLEARLTDGSAALLAPGFRVTGGRLTGTTPAGVRLAVSLDHVASLGFTGGSFVMVSDLKPTAIERTPFFPVPEGPTADAMLDFVCPVRFDRSPDGREITLRKQRYFKGIGVRPRTALTFDLGGRFTEFQSLCGIDDEVYGPGYGRGGGNGSVVFIVEVDGKKVYESPRVVGGREPIEVRVPVGGARTLKLVVALVPPEKMPKGVEDSPELDNAVWARPLLLR